MARKITHSIDTRGHQGQYKDEQADEGIPLAQRVRP